MSALSMMDAYGMPDLPSDCSPQNAALWSATVLLTAGLERGWDMPDIRSALFTLAIMPVAASSDSEIRAMFEGALAQIRAHETAAEKSSQ